MLDQMNCVSRNHPDALFEDNPSVLFKADTCHRIKFSDGLALDELAQLDQVKCAQNAVHRDLILDFEMTVISTVPHDCRLHTPPGVATDFRQALQDRRRSIARY